MPDTMKMVVLKSPDSLLKELPEIHWLLLHAILNEIDEAWADSKEKLLQLIDRLEQSSFGPIRAFKTSSWR